MTKKILITISRVESDSNRRKNLNPFFIKRVKLMDMSYKDFVTYSYQLYKRIIK